MIADVIKMTRLLLSPRSDSTESLYRRTSRISTADALLGRGSLAVSSGRITSARDMRVTRARVRAHDFHA